jgi:hypothetical protein
LVIGFTVFYFLCFWSTAVLVARLYIFSFKKNMTKIGFSFFFFSVFYWGVLSLWPLPSGSFSMTPLQGNYAKFEHFFQSNTVPQSLVVGSSMSDKLPSLGNGQAFYNLSLSGGSILTSLEILKYKKELPRRIYLETNVLTRPLDTAFVNDFLKKQRSVSSKIPIFQHRYQLVSYGLNQVFQIFNIKSQPKKKGSNRAAIVNSRLTQLREMEDDTLNLRKNIAVLTDQIDFFSSRGVEFVFFEMPVDAPLELYLNRSSERRKKEMCLLKAKFGRFAYRVHRPDDAYTTSDGVHLSYVDARRFAEHYLFAIR